MTTETKKDVRSYNRKLANDSYSSGEKASTRGERKSKERGRDRLGAYIMFSASCFNTGQISQHYSALLIG